ncbi:MAG: phosphorylase [Geminocystis sp.]|nr:phosphorylase [Geminocystis sp.]MCX8077707.1 phosphorylase [Geminocystis sp.]MDW8116599.1 phosphorylase [Geminocystis sp.]HIK37335.1 phosphorylase [Geminocystis sp. M7585_C2015_104]
MVDNHKNWWQKITDATRRAVELKAINSIPCNRRIIEENGIAFVVRVVDNLAKKEEAKKKQKEEEKKNPNFNPFLPYDKNLYVGDVGERHVAILNKFNVVNHHVLIVTREFESQWELLTESDFVALWTILGEVRGLGFYNGGRLSGASQPHKHLQFIPEFSDENLSNIPIDRLVLSYQGKRGLFTIDELSFVHKIAFFPQEELNNSPGVMGRISYEYYRSMLEDLSIEVRGKVPRKDYNLLVTQDWMMLVPRRKEKFKSISVNSLGFAGNLLVKNEEQLATVEKHKPLKILAKVGVEKEEWKEEIQERD